MSEAAVTPPVVSGEAGIVARLAAQKTKFKSAWKSLADKVAGYEKTIADLTAERDNLKIQADTSLAAKKVDELTGQLRTLKHRQAFDNAALKAGAKPSALEDLWKLSEIKAEADEPDAKAIGEVIDAQKQARAWAFGTTAEPKLGPDGKPIEPPIVKPGPASGQGGNTTASPTFSTEQLSDPKFVMMNWERISAAAAERVARGEI